MMYSTLLRAKYVWEIIITVSIFPAERVKAFLLVSLLEFSDLFIRSILWRVVIISTRKLKLKLVVELVDWEIGAISHIELSETFIAYIDLWVQFKSPLFWSSLMMHWLQYVSPQSNTCACRILPCSPKPS